MTLSAAVRAVGSARDVKRVIKRGPLPRIRRVATLATGGKTGCSMVGIGGRLIIGQVTRSAVGRDSLVIEGGIGPGDGVMARLAVGWQADRAVVGPGGGVVSRQVALHAVRRYPLMVKCGPVPGGCCVAGLTIRRQAAGHVVRVARALEVRQMARHACMRQSRKDAVTMARRTVGTLVCAGEWEAGMGKFRVAPADRPMAVLAIGRPSLREVIGIAGPPQIGLMTRGTLDRCARSCRPVRRGGSGSRRWPCAHRPAGNGSGYAAGPVLRAASCFRCGTAGTACPVAGGGGPDGNRRTRGPQRHRQVRGRYDTVNTQPIGALPGAVHRSPEHGQNGSPIEFGANHRRHDTRSNRKEMNREEPPDRDRHPTAAGRGDAYEIVRRMTPPADCRPRPAASKCAVGTSESECDHP